MCEVHLGEHLLQSAGGEEGGGIGIGKGGGREGREGEVNEEEERGGEVRKGERCQLVEEEVGEGEGSEYYREGVEGKEVSYTLVAQ